MNEDAKIAIDLAYKTADDVMETLSRTTKLAPSQDIACAIVQFVASALWKMSAQLTIDTLGGDPTDEDLIRQVCRVGMEAEMLNGKPGEADAFYSAEMNKLFGRSYIASFKPSLDS